MAKTAIACVLVCCVMMYDACGGGGSSATPTAPTQTGATTSTNVSTQACRTYATSFTQVTSTTAGASNTRTVNCTFDTIANQLKCTMDISTCGSVSFAVNYASRGDFVDEVSVIPPRILPTSQTTAPNPCGITNGVYSYDGQKRLLSYSFNGLTYSYSAWDPGGRPTTGTISGSPSPVNESWSYLDAARTATLVQSNGAGSTNTTYTYDANGILTTAVVVAGATVSTSTETIAATDKVCK